MKKLFVLCLLAFLGTNIVNAQAYSTAVGVKGGYPGYGGINLKHDFGGFFGDFTVGGAGRYLSFSALLEKQQTLEGNFDWYLGAGVYGNSWRNGYGYYYKDKYYNGGFAFGIIGVIGIEYTFEEIPLNLTFDLGPQFNLTPYSGFFFGSSGGIRYVIK